MERHYFDWAASGIPLSSGLPDTTDNRGRLPFGNPSSVHHSEGKAARAALEEARNRCAKALNVKAEELYFTSGGTESNAIVLFSLLCKPRRSCGFLYSAGEHPSIRGNAAVLEQLGVSCTCVGLQADGRTSAALLEKALEKNPDSRMAAIMAVNNETGAINDMASLSAILRRRQQDRGQAPIHLHCDAVQAAGKIPLDLQGWGVDSASISAHKLGGSRGTGILWLKNPIVPLIRGGGQEKQIRPGTENTPGALDMAKTLEAFTPLSAIPQEAADRMNALFTVLQKTGAFIPIPEDRKDTDSRFSPFILQCAFRNKSGMVIPGEVMVRALDEQGFAVSTGSACSSADKKRPVLDSMGIDQKISVGGIRISQGWSTTMEEIDSLAKAISGLCQIL